MSRSGSGATVATVGIKAWRIRISSAKHRNSFATTALDTLRRPDCRARARAHLYVCAVMLFCISDCFCVYVFALLVQLSCGDSEARGATRLVVGCSYLFALLFHM